MDDVPMRLRVSVTPWRCNEEQPKQQHYSAGAQEEVDCQGILPSHLGVLFLELPSRFVFVSASLKVLGEELDEVIDQEVQLAPLCEVFSLEQVFKVGVDDSVFRVQELF